ncbi:uncharacterized protein [Ptychodera flava]|uniref:uncharacterized protein n=1 Tax=Ptychodera flava TaxID=63121 RepID=UPI00396A3623
MPFKFSLTYVSTILTVLYRISPTLSDTPCNHCDKGEFCDTLFGNCHACNLCDGLPAEVNCKLCKDSKRKALVEQINDDDPDHSGAKNIQKDVYKWLWLPSGFAVAAIGATVWHFIRKRRNSEIHYNRTNQGHAGVRAVQEVLCHDPINETETADPELQSLNARMPMVHDEDRNSCFESNNVRVEETEV